MYRPKFVPQYDDPTTTLDWFDCTMASGAMGLDFDTLGHVQVLGGQLRAVSGDNTGGTTFGTPGLTQAWAHYGQTLHVQTGQSWPAVLNDLHQARGVMLQGMYSALPQAYHSPVNSHTFGGPHCVYLNPEFDAAGDILMGDPLNNKFIWVPPVALERYANALGSNQMGASNPQRIFIATTDPHVPAVAPSDPQAYKHTVQVTASPNLRVRAQPTTNSTEVGNISTNVKVATDLLRVHGGAYTVNGVVRTDWLHVPSKSGWIARGYTKVVA